MNWDLAFAVRERRFQGIKTHINYIHHIEIQKHSLLNQMKADQIRSVRTKEFVRNDRVVCNVLRRGVAGPVSTEPQTREDARLHHEILCPLHHAAQGLEDHHGQASQLK